MRVLRVILVILLLAPALFAERSGTPAPGPAAAPRDPRAMAIDDYQRGQRRLNDVAKMHHKLKKGADAKAAAKLQRNMEKQLQNAAGDFERAIRNDPSLFQAHSELGFALRKLGRYDQSLQAYDRALKLEPGFSPAIEYRAEAYLGLNRLEEARQAYILLFSGDRPRADVLFEAMKEWVNDRRSNPNGVSAEQIDTFAGWIEQRETIHRQTSALTGSSPIRSW